MLIQLLLLIHDAFVTADVVYVVVATIIAIVVATVAVNAVVVALPLFLLFTNDLRCNYIRKLGFRYTYPSPNIVIKTRTT